MNKIKLVLDNKGIKQKWLAEQLGKDCSTVSKWCTNSSQPSIETLLQIAQLLHVDIKQLLNSSLDEQNG